MLWNYTGLSAEEMEERITTVFERNLTTTVNDMEHTESQTYNGKSIIKVYFHPNVKIEMAVAQITAQGASAARQMPPGTTPPFILVYNASSVPILQLALSGRGLSEQQLFDFGINNIRTGLATVQGAAIPYPYGGKQRQVMIDIRPDLLQAKGLSPADVVNAVSAQNLILPSGTSKIGPFEYDVDLNSSPRRVQEINDLPIKALNNTTLYIHDVANVRDGFSPQTNIVLRDGARGVLMTVMKTGQTSTLEVVKQVRERCLPSRPRLPRELKIEPIADQSIFVRAAVSGVIREAIIAACLTAAMILLFLGSWRSTIIIAISIPLSILISICVMSALGETINIMTLGGLALAVGILVDDATVEIENIHRNLVTIPEVVPAILEGARQIAVPALVSTLVHLHRVFADVSADGRGALSIRPTGRSGGVRDAGLVPALANSGSDAGHVSVQAACSRGARTRGMEPRRPFPTGLRETVGRSPQFIPRHAGRLYCAPGLVHPAFPGGLCGYFLLSAMAGSGFLPQYRRRTLQPARAHQDRDAH